MNILIIHQFCLRFLQGPIRNYKYKSGAQKRKEKLKNEALQKVRLILLISILIHIMVNDIDIENQHDIESNENEKTSSDRNKNEEGNQRVNECEKTSSDLFNFPFDIDGPGNWDRIGHINMRDFIVERGSKRVIKEVFIKDDFGRNFSNDNYIRELPNGEKQDKLGCYN